MLRSEMPEQDLEALEALHRAEEETPRPNEPLRRPMGLRLPRGGSLPESEAWLRRFYEGERMPREKKPAVFDHERSWGPWFTSIDHDPLCVLDGMSQTATLVGGFGEDPVVRTYMDGGFGDTILTADDTSVSEPEAARAFADRLRALVPGLPHVAFTNAGAEAVEKAFALCRANGPSGATQILAFEGSFHGRTLTALHATYNPVKRAPFEIKGHETTFMPFPVWATPSDDDPLEDENLVIEITEGDPATAPSIAGDDELLRHELEILRDVHAELASGKYYCVVIEPMQSEGGDRYATGRFFRLLRMLTRRHNVPLVFDEVQTGFGLGGPFAWHTTFELVDVHGQPDWPDAVVFAKRAQVGVVMSRFSDPEPTSAHPASLIRGLLHADDIEPEHARDVEKLIRERLGAVAGTYPSWVANPRGRGYAFAFDLPEPAHLSAYIAQRFYRGVIVFGAGDRTVRYRLSRGFGPREFDILFDSIHRTLRWMSENPNTTPPKWQDNPDRETRRSVPGRRIRTARRNEADVLVPQMMEMEARVYEPARREPREKLQACFDDPHGVVIVCEVPGRHDWTMAGFACGAALERFPNVPGAVSDQNRGRENTFYSVSITVDRGYRGLGLGRALKRSQVDGARKAVNTDGSRRYTIVSGRNRVGAADAMTRLNRSFGAYEVQRLGAQYGDPDAEAVYYRLPLGPFVPDVPVREARLREADMRMGTARPFVTPPESLRKLLERGDLYGPAVNKLTLVNYVTPAVVRGVEWISALTPDHPHLYMTSGRDELVDKSLRILRWHRKKAQVAISWDGSYFGHTTGAARSLSDPSVHRQGPAIYEWPHVAHPADVGADESIASLRDAVQAAGGADAVLGFFAEPVQERTGRTVPSDFWPALEAMRKDLGIPIALCHTASACYRSGDGMFASSGDFVGDLLFWWGGGQVGFLHCSPDLYVDKPLTMVSTWDGDELSLIRVHHQLRAARGLNLRAAIEALDAAVGEDARGLGLYRVVDAGAAAVTMATALRRQGVLVRRYPNGALAFAPPLDTALEDAARLAEARAEALEVPA